MICNVKVYPRAKRNCMSVGADIRIWMTAKPVDGAANDAAIKRLAEYFNVPKSKIKIIRGDKSRIKTVEIDLD